MARRRLTRRQREQIGLIQEQRRRRAARRAERQADSSDALGAERAGRVIANYGPELILEDAAGGLHRCSVRQNLGGLACGDRVVWQPTAFGDGVVVAVEPRRSLLTRPDYSGRPKLIAANMDQVGVVVAPRPALNEFLVDRYLVAVEAIGVAALIVFNKVDLPDPATRAELEARLDVYRRIGYPVLPASTKTEHGLDALQARLAGHISILVGQSGVGKSSLIQALLPDREIRIQAVSEATGMGTHATTTATLYHLPGGGDLIDSPGIRSFELGELALEDLDRGFREFAPYLGRCRFSNCGHTVEPGCALQAAVAQREIDARRLASYHQLKTALAGG